MSSMLMPFHSGTSSEGSGSLTPTDIELADAKRLGIKSDAKRNAGNARVDTHSPNWRHCLCFATILHPRTGPQKGPPRTLSPTVTSYPPETSENRTSHTVVATKGTR